MKIYHFIGIGGVSMSALAAILHSQGQIVQGSDIANSEYTKALKNMGIKVFIGHNEENVKNADIVVYNSAISENNEELVYAIKNNLQIYSRAEMLEIISAQYENVIAISGAHGKTTTTAMLTEIFIKAGLNPTAHLGGVFKSHNSNLIIGGNKFFITEACEYKKNFLHLNPKVSIILNVEPEHLDYFKTYENVLDAFGEFANKCELLVCYDKVDIAKPNKIVFGDNGYMAKKIKRLKQGAYKFVCYYNDKKLFKVKMNVIGRFNVTNALSCIAVAKHFNIANKHIKKALKEFKGVLRRFEIKAKKPLIVHDYAHHPSEIKSVIKATRNFRKKKLIVVFQPHTYSRTLSLMDDFKNAFDGADEVLIIKTYSAREEIIKGGTAKDLYYNLKDKNYNLEYFSSISSCYNYLKENLRKSDTLLILGAGDIFKLADKFEKNAKNFIWQKWLT